MVLGTVFTSVVSSREADMILTWRFSPTPGKSILRGISKRRSTFGSPMPIGLSKICSPRLWRMTYLTVRVGEAFEWNLFSSRWFRTVGG